MTVPLPAVSKPALAFIIGLSSVFMLALVLLLSKLLAPSYTPMELVFWRNLIATIPLLILLLRRDGLKIPTISQPRPMIGRTILGSVSLVLSFTAYANLPMADASAIIMASTLFLMVLAHFYLGERLRRDRAIAVGVGLIGVLVLLQPSGAFSLVGTSAAIGAALLLGMMRVMLRQLGKTDNALNVTFYYAFGGLLFSSLWMPFVGHWPALNTLWLLLLMGLCGALGQYLNSQAYRYAEATFVNILIYNQLIFMGLFDWFIWHHPPAHHTLIGGGIIVGSNIALLLVERHKQRPTAD